MFSLTLYFKNELCSCSWDADLNKNIFDLLRENLLIFTNIKFKNLFFKKLIYLK